MCRIWIVYKRYGPRIISGSFVSCIIGDVFLEDLGENLVGTYRGFGLLLLEFGDYAFDVVVGDLLSKHTNVLQEPLDSFYGLFLIVRSVGGNAAIALRNHVLLEAGWDFLLVTVDSERCMEGCWWWEVIQKQ